MGLRVNTNVAALQMQQQLRNNARDIGKTMERLSSGQRINRASDDLVGVANSESIKASLRGLRQVEKNAQDGMTLTQVAEGALNQVSNMLIRLRELAIQCASDTVGEHEKYLINLEFSEIVKEIDRIANTTEFNGTQLLAGQGEKVDFQINLNNSNSLDRISYDPTLTSVTKEALGIEMANVETKESAQMVLGMVDKAINNVSEIRANLGAIQSRLSSSSENITNSIEHLTAANSRLRDSDVAVESSELAKKNTLLQAGTSVLAQANQQAGQALALLSKGS